MKYRTPLIILGVLIILGIIFSSKIIAFKDAVITKAGLIVLDDFKEGIENLVEHQGAFPEPLFRKDRSARAVMLSSEKVIALSNTERTNASLPAVTSNVKLTNAALAKAKDMLAKQYFAHESPSGVGPGTVAKNAGYDFISVGENLAAGVFKDEADLVKAWMDSPGHRANILGKQWTEIGVGIVKGNFQGSEQILAVQEFGLPATLCKKPLDSERKEVERIYAEARRLRGLLEEIREKISQVKRSDPEYNTLVKNYNDAVEKYNAGVKDASTKAADYNKKVGVFNTCMNRLTS